MKEKITECSLTDSGLTGLPLKCQLQSNMPAALMICRNSGGVCVRAFIVRVAVMSVRESDDSRAVLQPPKAFFLPRLSGSHHVGHSSYTSKGLCMRRTVNFSIFYW